MFNTDRYILVSTYVEYNRLLEYWRSNLGEYEIIYAVDSVDIISEVQKIIKTNIVTMCTIAKYTWI